VTFVAAATGLVVIALQIGYLPTIYGAYNRRETLVNMLESRAGEPAWGVELLAREQLIGSLDSLGPFFNDWERWAADLTESHVNYPWLLSFRSPYPLRSWVVSLLAVLDAAALHLALVPSRAPSAARHCLRTGFLGLRALAGVYRVELPTDPRPDASLDLTYEEFSDGLDRLQAVGFPIERSREEAWRHFRGWRVNYEAPPTCSPTGSGRSSRPGRASAPACTCAATSRWCRSARATAAPTTSRATPPCSRRGPSHPPGGRRRPLSVWGQPESIQVAHQEADGEERAGQHAKDEADAPWAEALDGDRPGRPGSRARGWAGRRAASAPARSPPAGRTGARY
jgi:hypothetical protein